MSSDDGKATERDYTKPPVQHTPKKPTSEDRVTRSKTKAATETATRVVSEMDVERINKILEENEALKTRLRQRELTDESEVAMPRNDDIVLLLVDIRNRLESLETRSKQCSDKAESASNVERASPTPVHNVTLTRDMTTDRGDNAIMHAKLPKGGWLKNPFDELRYYGKSDTQNPLKFFKKFEKIAAYEEIDEREQIYFFGKCMRGTASNWFDVREPESISEAKASFVDYFWGDEQQARFREEIYTGSYKTNDKLSMAEYALDMAKRAKHLDPPMSETEIIRNIKRHFGKEISREIRPTTVRNIEEFAKLLDDLEYEMRREKSTKAQIVATKAQALNKTAKAEIKNKYAKPEVKPETRVNNVEATETQRRMTPVVNKRRYQASDDRVYSQRATGSESWKQNNTKPNKEAYEERKTRTDYRQSKRGKDMSESESEDNAVGTEVVLYDRKVAKKAIKNLKSRESRNPSTERKAYKLPNVKSKREVAAITSKQRKTEDECKGESEALSDVEDRKVAIIRTRELIRDLEEVTKQDQSADTKKPKPYVRVKIGNVALKALIDTGAQISAVTKDLYDKLSTEAIDMRVIPIKQFVLRGAFNDKGQPIANRIQMEFQIENEKYTHEFYVVKKLTYEMILGFDFLNEQAAVLRCSQSKFHCEFHNETNKTSSESRENINAINADEATTHLNKLIAKYSKLFEEKIGRVTHYEHNIEMRTDKAFKSKTYPIPDAHRESVREHILDLEKEGIIKREATEYVNPLVVVVKKTGEIRLCLDARELNKKMSNDHDQPPTIDEVFRRIGSRKYFTTLDVAKAFWQIPLNEQSAKYTGFLFDNQTYVFKRLPFGLKTAGASFTRAIRKALGDKCDSFTIVYLDDILIASNTIEEHLFHLNYVLKRLEKVGFKLNASKCEFMKTEIKFLGHTFDEITAEMNEDTKTAIKNFARPKNKKGIQAFLGLVNWDRRFIKGLAEKTKPLENLLRKDTKFEWGSEQQRAFNAIKLAFDEAEKLYVIKADRKFGMYIDASKYGLGARLYQYKDSEPDKKYTIAYASRSLKGAELNYTVTEIECLALVWALKKWHTTLLGRKIQVHTDHRALKFLKASSADSSRIARWISFLNEFDLEICHVPGKDNKLADTLSRNNIENGYAKKSCNTKTIALIQQPNDKTETTEWVELIENAQNENDDLQLKLVEEPDRYFVRDNLIRVLTNDGERIAIPDNVRWRLVKRIHEYILHFGTDKTVEFAKQYFSINSLEKLARDVVASCYICQATKYYTRATRGVEYFDLPEKPEQTVSLDIFGPLPQSSKGNKYVLVIMDQFSKLTKFYVMPNQKLDIILDKLQLEYFNEIGIPDTILTDNGGQFITDRWKEFARGMGIQIRKTSPYNPQSNPVERVMREIGRIIRVYASERQVRWDKIIKRAEDTINSTVHTSTGYKPIQLHKNQDNLLVLDDRLKPREPESDEEDDTVETRIQRRVIQAAEVLRRRAEKRKVQTDKHEEAKPFEEGDQVWIRLHRRSDASRRLTRKIHLVYEGPYIIGRIIRPNAYLVVDDNNQVIGTFNARQLKPHREAKMMDPVQIQAMEEDLQRKEKPQERRRRHRQKIDEALINMIEIIQPEAMSDKSLNTLETTQLVEVSLSQSGNLQRDFDTKNEVTKEAVKHVKRRRRQFISEKGMRYISRIRKLLSGDIKAHHVMGQVNEIRVNIIMDTRGEFNVITTKAVEKIEELSEQLPRTTQSSEIPAYLKRERYAKIEAVKINVQVFGRTIKIEAMELEGDEACLILARNARRQLANQIRESRNLPSKSPNEIHKVQSSNTKRKRHEETSELERWDSKKSKTVMQQWEEQMSRMRDKLTQWEAISVISRPEERTISQENIMTKVHLRPTTDKEQLQETSDESQETIPGTVGPKTSKRVPKSRVICQKTTQTSTCTEINDVPKIVSLAEIRGRSDDEVKVLTSNLSTVNAKDELNDAKDKPAQKKNANHNEKSVQDIKCRKVTPKGAPDQSFSYNYKLQLKQNQNRITINNNKEREKTESDISDDSRKTIELIKLSDSEESSQGDVIDTCIIPGKFSYINADDLIENSSNELLVQNNSNSSYEIYEIKPNLKQNEWFANKSSIQIDYEDASVAKDNYNVIGSSFHKPTNQTKTNNQSKSSNKGEPVAIKPQPDERQQSISHRHAKGKLHPNEVRREIISSKQQSAPSASKSASKITYKHSSHKRKRNMELENEEKEAMKRATASLLYEKLRKKKRRRIAYLKSVTIENKATRENLEPEQVQEMLKADEEQADDMFETLKRKHEEATNIDMLVDIANVSLAGKHVATIKTMINIETIENFDRVNIPPTRLTIDIVKGEIKVIARECGMHIVQQSTVPDSESAAEDTQPQQPQQLEEEDEEAMDEQPKLTPSESSEQPQAEKEKRTPQKKQMHENKENETFSSSISETCKTSKRTAKIIRIENPKVLSVTKKNKSWVVQNKQSPEKVILNKKKKKSTPLIESDESADDPEPPTTPGKELNLPIKASLSPLARVVKPPRGDHETEEQRSEPEDAADLRGATTSTPKSTRSERSVIRTTSVRLKRLGEAKSYTDNK
ncbi:uncharacterized protein LOC118646382 [Monomorium pharaonis]|uniref:uncharacterized protein LOC118646382 n=1 Tax=Monomorium pharaonis TaxID=307658 RepID=UPI001746F34A|nr:uncharacterized protein LOC118646382 [Monomorium pharaonis]